MSSSCKGKHGSRSCTAYLKAIFLISMRIVAVEHVYVANLLQHGTISICDQSASSALFRGSDAPSTSHVSPSLSCRQLSFSSCGCLCGKSALLCDQTETGHHLERHQHFAMCNTTNHRPQLKSCTLWSVCILELPTWRLTRRLFGNLEVEFGMIEQQVAYFGALQPAALALIQYVQDFAGQVGGCRIQRPSICCADFSRHIVADRPLLYFIALGKPCHIYVSRCVVAIRQRCLATQMSKFTA